MALEHVGREITVNKRRPHGPNKRVVIGRYGLVAPDQARRLAQELLGRVAGGADPAQERADRRGMPSLGETFEEYLAANPSRKASTEALYRGQMRYCLGDWLSRPLDTITRREVEARFHRVSKRHGWAVANHVTSLLRSVYRRPCVDYETLRNPVELWLAGGGRYNRTVRRRIAPPAELLPRRRAGIEAEVLVPATRDIFWLGMYTGMRRGEILTSALGSGESRGAHPAGRRNQDRRAAGTSRYASVGGHLRAAAG